MPKQEKTTCKQRRHTNPNNPNNSTLIQGLLELIKQDSIDDNIRRQIKDLKAVLDNMPDAVQSADKIVANNQYADDKLKFYKCAKYDNTAGLYQMITGDQYYLLSVMASVMSQHNLVKLSVDDMIIMTGMSKSTIQRHIKQLIKHGFLAIHTPAQPKRGIPRIYMINPLIYDCGKPSGIKINKFWQLADKSIISRDMFVEILETSDYTQGLTILPITKEKIGTLEYKEKGDCANTK